MLVLRVVESDETIPPYKWFKISIRRCSPQACNRRVDGMNLLFQTDQNIDQCLPIGIMTVHSKLRWLCNVLFIVFVIEIYMQLDGAD